MTATPAEGRILKLVPGRSAGMPVAVEALKADDGWHCIDCPYTDITDSGIVAHVGSNHISRVHGMNFQL